METESKYLESKANELKTQGVTVVNLNLSEEQNKVLQVDWLSVIQNINLRDFKTNNPEFGFVLGAFGALGNPASFHSIEIYILRFIIFHQLKNIFKKINPNKKLEMLFDRIAIRRAGTTICKETFHRDTCAFQDIDDDIYGGWINLDSIESQYFSFVPETHTSKGTGGFEKIEGNYKNSKIKIEVKPKQVIIFNQNIIHEIFNQKIKKTNIRLYLGWRHTYSNTPLLNNTKDPQKNINIILRDQIVPALPSGDIPYMYSKQHPGLHRHMVIKLSEEIKDFYKIKNDKYESVYVVSRSLIYPIEKIKIPDKYKTIYYPNNI